MAAKAAAIRMTFKGEKQLMRKLQALEQRAGRRVMRKAVSTALNPIVRTARANVPRDIDTEGLLAGTWPDINIQTGGSRRVVTSRKVKGKRQQRTRRAKDLSAVIRKGIGKRVKTYKSTHVMYGVVGPKTRIKVEIGTRESSQGGRRKPKFLALSTLAKLVEYGTSTHRAQPFIRPAFDQARGPALTAFRNKLKTEIKKEAKRA